MKILERLGWHSTPRREEDPQKVVKNTQRALTRAIKEARRDLLSTMADAKRVTQKAEDLQNEARNWREKAKLALRAGDEGLAKKALVQHQEATKTAQKLRAMVDQQQSVVHDMKNAIKESQIKLELLTARSSSLAAEVSAFRELDSADIGSPNRSRKGGAFGKLRKLHERIDDLEAEIEVGAALYGNAPNPHNPLSSGPTSGEDADFDAPYALEAEFAELEKANAQTQLDKALETLRLECASPQTDGASESVG